MAENENSKRFAFDFRIRKDEGRPQTRVCDVPGCTRAGEFRAPKGRNSLLEFHWFCLEHVRAYNEGWDFFQGMPDEAVTAFQRDAVTGHRPTWRLSDRVSSPFAAAQARGNPLRRRAEARATPRARHRPLPLQAEALATLGLDAGASLNEVKARYKELVKRFHPDANGGDRTAEERLAQVIRAYSTLKTSGYV